MSMNINFEKLMSYVIGVLSRDAKKLRQRIQDLKRDVQNQKNIEWNLRRHLKSVEEKVDRYRAVFDVSVEQGCEMRGDVRIRVHFDPSPRCWQGSISLDILKDEKLEDVMKLGSEIAQEGIFQVLNKGR